MSIMSPELARVAPWLRAAIERGNCNVTYDEVVRGVMQNEYVLITNQRGAAVLETVEQVLGGIYVNIALAGGEMDAVLDLLTEIEAIAVDAGAKAITIIGRPGWARILTDRGFSTESVLLKKELR